MTARELWLRLMLWVLRHERSGLRRERARYHAERLGLDQALRENAARDQVLQQDIATVDGELRSMRTARRFPLSGA